MENLDRWIKDNLENHASARPEDAWSRFQSYKDGSDLESDQRFDQFVKTKLEKHQAHFQNKLWAGLSFNIHKEAFFKKELWVAKTFEILFLILAFWQILQFGFLSTDRHIIEPVTENNAPITQRIPQRESNLFGSEQYESTIAGTNAEVNPGDSRQNANQYDSLPSDGSSGTLSGALFAENAILPLKNEGDHTENVGIVSFVAPFETPLFEIIEVINGDGPSSELALHTLDKVATLSPQVDAIRHPLLLETKIQPSGKKYIHRITLAILQDFHFINTPYDALLEEYGYDQIAYGGGGSIGHSWDGGKWGIRSQLTYRYLNYLPKPYTEVFDGDLKRGFFAESIRNIELNKMSLSLLATRSIGRIGQWHCYTITGATVHAAVLANYDRRAFFIPGQDVPNPDSPPLPQNASKTSEKRFDDGLFENGPVLENTYLTLDIGVGVERTFNDRLSVFIEPNYQHNPFKKSLGPNSDRINTLSFFTGIRIQL